MPLQSPWALRIDPGVLEKLKHLPKADAKRIAAVIRGLPLNPYFGDIQKLKGQEIPGDGGVARSVFSTNYIRAIKSSPCFELKEGPAQPIEGAQRSPRLIPLSTTEDGKTEINGLPMMGGLLSPIRM